MKKLLTPTTEQKSARNSENLSWFIYEADYFQYSEGLMTKSVGQAKQSAMELNLKRSEYTETYQVRSELMKEKFKTILNRMPAQFED